MGNQVEDKQGSKGGSADQDLKHVHAPDAGELMVQVMFPQLGHDAKKWAKWLGALDSPTKMRAISSLHKHPELGNLFVVEVFAAIGEASGDKKKDEQDDKKQDDKKPGDTKQGDFAGASGKVEGNVGAGQGSFKSGSVDASLGPVGGTIKGERQGVKEWFDEGMSDLLHDALGLQDADRSLTGKERTLLKSVYGDSLDLSKISINRDSLFTLGGGAVTVGNGINFPASNFKKGADGKPTMELEDNQLDTLVHEAGHVWQFQHAGLSYIPDALIHQRRSEAAYGTRNQAYEWQPFARSGVPFEQWNPEQQAEMASEFNQALRLIRAGETVNGEGENVYANLSLALPYIGQMRAGVGAKETSATLQTGGPGHEPGTVTRGMEEGMVNKGPGY